MPLSMDGSLGGSSLSVISIADHVAEQWFAAAGKNLKAVQSEFDTGDVAMGFALESVNVSAEVDIAPVRSHGRNVLALLPAGDTPTQQMVLVGAHIDHLGNGEASGSLAKPEEAGGTHRGADDRSSRAPSRRCEG